ncbi:MAG TPA: disulfide bond formation protein B, partial [Porticoccaceae bacterium]|nr:disulfide bond formation protein B [Porticoccaceae bacterium]
TMLMRGDGQCAEIQWQFLGLSIPAWVWLSCVGYLGIALFQLLRKDSVLRA